MTQTGLNGCGKVGRATVVLALLSGVLASSACEGNDSSAASDESVVKIGLMVDFADQGDTRREVAVGRMALREINDAGGLTVKGQRYKLDVEPVDGKVSVEGAISALDSLMSKGIAFSMSPPSSFMALGSASNGSDGASIAGRDRHIIQISGSATNPGLSKLDTDGYQWRTIPPDDRQGEVAGQYLAEELGVKTVSVIIRGDVYGRGLAAAMVSAFESRGGTVLASVEYDTTKTVIPDVNTHDYKDELATLFQDKPEAIYLATSDEGGQIGNSAVRQGYVDAYGDAPPFFVAGDAMVAFDTLANGVTQFLDNLTGTAPYPNPESADSVKFRAAMEGAKLGSPINYEAYRYDAFYIFALAIQQADSFDPEIVKGKIAAVTLADEAATQIHVGDWALAKSELLAGRAIDYEGASGSIELQANGDPGAAAYAVWRPAPIAGGGYEFAYKPVEASTP